MTHDEPNPPKRRLANFAPPCREPVERYRLCGVCQKSSEVDGVRRCSRLVAESAAMGALLVRVGVVAASRAAVMLRGETGTGKEVLARVIHSNSPRYKGPFVAVNVAALPPELLESELFGHVKGAFTGAVSTTNGLFGDAHGGTLLLDEIGEMPLALQAKLLRVLQESEIRRVGETRARPIDVRIISATHRDLGALVAAGAFREDLYYRLKVLPLSVPPLRERREDVLPLLRSFAARFGHAAPELTPRARSWLASYHFPGNVRELGNIVEHALAYAGDQPIDLAHFPEDLEVSKPARKGAPEVLRPLAAVEREHIQRVLQACRNNQVEAARVLQIGRSTLWRKLSANG